MTTYSVPVFRQNEQGERFLYAVVTADVTLEDLQEVVGQLHVGESSYSMLFSPEGRAMARFLTAWRQPMRHLFPIPVLSAASGIVIIIMNSF